MRRPPSNGGTDLSSPVRTCIVCRRKLPKDQLVRIGWTEGKATVTGRGKQPGRGAYLCDRAECLEIAFGDSRLLAGKLRARVTVSELEELRLLSERKQKGSIG